MDTDTQSICNHCHGNISTADYYCPNCGKNVREKPLSTSIVKQIWLYIFSLLLPPLGIWPAIKYLKQEDGKARKIGIIILVLTAVSIVLTIWATMNFVNSFNSALNNQMNIYQVTGLQGTGL